MAYLPFIPETCENLSCQTWPRGFGFAGKVFHAPVIRAVEGLRLTTIVQRHGPPDPRYPDVEFVHSVDEMLTGKIDLVVVATPNTSHHAIAKQCLLAGRHVVVDKPFTPTLAEAMDLVQIAKQQRRIVTVYQDRRYNRDFATVQQVVSEGTLGRVVLFESHFDRFRPDRKPNAWREETLPGSGVWFDIGPHLFDQALLLFGAPDAIGATFASNVRTPWWTTRSTSRCSIGTHGPCYGRRCWRLRSARPGS